MIISWTHPQSESQNSSEEESENTEEKLNKQMEIVNTELDELDDAAKRRIRNLEFAAERYLWYPDINSTETVRVGSGLVVTMSSVVAVSKNSSIPCKKQLSI